MKIAVLGHLRYPIKQPFAGGLEHFTYTLVTGLQQRGCQVTLFADSHSDPNLNLADITVDTSFCQTPSEKSHQAYLAIMDYLSRQKFDLIHDNSLNYFPPVLQDTIDCPLVTTLHTPPFPLLWSAVKYRQNRGDGRFISVSRYNTSLWELSPLQSTTIYNGINPDVFGFAPTPSKPLAVWIGRIIPDKGTSYAIAAAKTAKINLIIAGPIGDRLYFEREIEPHLGDGVEYAGHLEQKQLVSLLQSATVSLCTPVWPEPFGLVVIESLACGTPVVAFDRGAMAEILNSDTGVIVPPDRVEAMAEGIIQAAKLSRHACRERVLNHFSLSQMISSYIATFETIIAQHQQRLCTSAITSTPMAMDIPKERSPLLSIANPRLP